MRKTFILSALALTLLSLGISSCKKDKPVTEDPVIETPQIGTIPGFTWTPAGGSVVFADSSRCISAFKNIIAYKKGNSNTVDLMLTDISVGTYSMSQSLGNTLEFVTAATTYTAKSGTLSITANSNAKLTGNFSISLSGGTVTAITGEFINIPIK